MYFKIVGSPCWIIVCYASHDLNNEPFNNQTVFDHLITKLVFNSDPHCTGLVPYSDLHCIVLNKFLNFRLAQLSLPTKGWAVTISRARTSLPKPSRSACRPQSGTPSTKWARTSPCTRIWSTVSSQPFTEMKRYFG